MSRLPKPPPVEPARYGVAARKYATDMAAELDWLRTDGRCPALADALSLQANDLVKLVDEAMKNDVGGQNVAPHLLTTMDAQLHELSYLRRWVG